MCRDRSSWARWREASARAAAIRPSCNAQDAWRAGWTRRGPTSGMYHKRGTDEPEFKAIDLRYSLLALSSSKSTFLAFRVVPLVVYTTYGGWKVWLYGRHFEIIQGEINCFIFNEMLG